MKWTSALAIFLLFWVMSAFFVMPFHGRRADEAVSDIAGADRGAPANIRFGAIAKQITIVAVVSFGFYYFVYTQFNA